MEIRKEKHGSISIFKVLGRLDSNTSPDFEKEITEVIDNGGQNIVIDFETLDYISSAGLRVILKTAKTLKQSAGKLVLCSMKDYVREVFEISGFDSILPIVATKEDALKRF